VTRASGAINPAWAAVLKVVPGTPVHAAKEAEMDCSISSETVAAGGEIVFVAEHVMVTLAVADFVGSATLVTMTLTVEGAGGTAGAT
jgi:hypothetical protein